MNTNNNDNNSKLQAPKQASVEVEVEEGVATATNATTNNCNRSHSHSHSKLSTSHQMLKSQIQLLEKQLLETRRLLHRQEQQQQQQQQQQQAKNCNSNVASTPILCNGKAYYGALNFTNNISHERAPLLARQQQNSSENKFSSLTSGTNTSIQDIHNEYHDNDIMNMNISIHDNENPNANQPQPQPQPQQPPPPQEIPTEIRMPRNSSEYTQGSGTGSHNGNTTMTRHTVETHRSGGTALELFHHMFDDAVSLVRTEEEYTKEEVNHECDIYLNSSILERGKVFVFTVIYCWYCIQYCIKYELNCTALHLFTYLLLLLSAFPERQFALFVTLLFELPVLCMISGGSGQICALVGRSKYQLLMAFLPLTSAISGNVGLQASTLTTRAISHNHVTASSYMPWFLKEIGASFCLALCMGTLMGSLSFYASGWDMAFALTIFVAQVISIVTAGCTGTIAPLLFSFIFRRDSGKWGGPLETAVQDIVGSFAMVVISYKILQLMGPLPVDPDDMCGGSIME